eukprot:96583-Pelagomonas_calceolata.AAC.1
MEQVQGQESKKPVTSPKTGTTALLRWVSLPKTGTTAWLGWVSLPKTGTTALMRWRCCAYSSKGFLLCIDIPPKTRSQTGATNNLAQANTRQPLASGSGSEPVTPAEQFFTPEGRAPT